MEMNMEPLTQDVFVESSWMLPILEAGSMAFRSSSTGKNQTQKNQAYDDNNFDTGQIEFEFSKEFNTKVVDENNGD
jgi:hypothetical protein